MSIPSSLNEDKGMDFECLPLDSRLTDIETTTTSRDGTLHRPSVSGHHPETRTVNGKEVEVHTWNGPDDKDNPYAPP